MGTYDMESNGTTGPGLPDPGLPGPVCPEGGVGCTAWWAPSVSVPGKRTGVIGLAGSVGGVGAPGSGVAGCGVAAGSFTGPLHAAANAPAKSRLDQRTSLGMVLSASKR